MSRRVAKAKDLGLVADLGRGPAFPSRLVVVQPLPDDWDVLPEPSHVEEAMRTGFVRLEDRRRKDERQDELHAGRVSGEEPACRTGDDADAAAPASATEIAPTIAAQDAPLQTPSDAPAIDTPTPATTPAKAPPSTLPPIIADAPRPDQPDGGYRGRRAINAYREAVRACGR